MEEYVSIIFNFVNEEIERWKEGKLDVYEKIVELCLKVAMVNFFGKESLKYSSELLERMESLLRRPTLLGLNKNETKYFEISFIAKQKENVDGISKIFQKIIEEERLSKTKGTNFLKILLNEKQQDGNRFSDKKIKDHMATILFAGHGTVSMLLSWIIFCIAKNPESMKNLKEEAENSSWLKNDKSPTIEEVVQSKVSYQIVLEGMRMYPPVWNLPRQAIKDVYIQNVFIPKGMTVILSSYVSHRNEKYYKDPESWNPKRWTKEFESSLPKGSYFPFGMSTRKCLGAEFGILESQIILLCLAKKYRWKNYPENVDPEISPSISLRPKNGIPIIIEKDFYEV
jgi:cytochrome P450